MKLLIAVVLCAITLASAKITPKADDHDHESMDWWENGVFYQIYPRSFKDSNGDGEGDLKGITSKLQHLKDLGVTGTWLSPIFKSPFKDGGYDVEDFYTVDPRFGTNDDLDELFAKAKELGIKIILDFVPNHTSNLNKWFQASRNSSDPEFEKYKDWYVWRACPMVGGDRQLPNNWRAVFNTPAWSFDTVRGECYLHQFAPEQPDLNYRHAPVRAEMMSMLRYWLEQGVDGFRIDAINHMYETIGMPSEAYYKEDGDKTDYNNMYHNHTMNLVRWKIQF